jgi:uncharacterized protein (DUF362 family)
MNKNNIFEHPAYEPLEKNIKKEEEISSEDMELGGLTNHKEAMVRALRLSGVNAEYFDYRDKALFWSSLRELIGGGIEKHELDEILMNEMQIATENRDVERMGMVMAAIKESPMLMSAKSYLERSGNENKPHLENQIEQIKESPVFYAEKMGRVVNLEQAFDAFEKKNGEIFEKFKNGRILLKINMVDPIHPEGCTSLETIKTIINLVEKYKPREICIGDMPSGIAMRRGSWQNLVESYEKELITSSGISDDTKRRIKFSTFDLSREPDIIIKNGQKEFQAKDLRAFDGIINITQPKMHGEFGFSGCSKNLMGFMGKQSREYIHGSVDEKGNPTDSKYLEKEDGLLPVKSERLGAFISSMIKSRPDIINVLDGHEFLVGHEHFGTLKKIDFAMMSRNPFSVDQQAIDILGLGIESKETSEGAKLGKISYLLDSEFENRNIVLQGKQTIKDAYPSNLHTILFPYELSVVKAIQDEEFLIDRKTTEIFYLAVFEQFFMIKLNDILVEKSKKNGKREVELTIEDIDDALKYFYKQPFSAQSNGFQQSKVKHGYDLSYEFRGILSGLAKSGNKNAQTLLRAFNPYGELIQLGMAVGSIGAKVYDMAHDDAIWDQLTRNWIDAKRTQYEMHLSQRNAH